jgi:hypothetical protein
MKGRLTFSHNSKLGYKKGMLDSWPHTASDMMIGFHSPRGP